LARIGKAAGWIVHLVAVIWFAALAALISLLLFICRRAAKNEFDVVADVPFSPAK